jgi:hypothetical protein
VSITIAKFLEALGTDIFPGSSTDAFIIKCKQREENIKTFLNVCWKIIEQHLYTPGLETKRLSHWKKVKIESNIKNLLAYLDELVLALNKQSIEDTINSKGITLQSKIVFEPDFNLLTINSYYGSIVTDIYWIDSLTVRDATLIGKGELDLNELIKYSDLKISFFKKLLKEHRSTFEGYKLDSLKEALKCFDYKLYKAFNLLLLNIIEGITRKLGMYLIDQQKLDVDAHDEEYNSLDSFLRKIPWKKDLEISISKYILLTGDYSRSQIEKNQDIPPLPKTIFVNLKSRLDFLRRRFKENRDMVIHGDELEYDDKLQSFINISALVEVLSAIIEYKCLYKKNG